jgi:hypothetical protein
MAFCRAERLRLRVGTIRWCLRAAAACLVSLISLGWLASVASAADPTPAVSVQVRAIGDFAKGLVDLALTPNGQRLYGLSTDGMQVISIDCGRNTTATVRVVMEGDSPDGPGLRLGCIDTSVVAILRDSPNPVVTTHRVPSAPELTDAAEPLQRVAIAEETGTTSLERTACLTVSPTRNWMALTAIAENAPVVLKAAVAGVRLGSFSTRNSPGFARESGIAAATVSPADELVLVTRPQAAVMEGQALDPIDTLSMYASPGGWELLRFGIGLRGVRDACFTAESGSLWVITGGQEPDDPSQPEGLWRLDAVLRNRRQAVEAVFVSPLEDPSVLAGGNDNVLYAVVNGGQQVVEIRPDNTPTTQRD